MPIGRKKAVVGFTLLELLVSLAVLLILVGVFSAILTEANGVWNSVRAQEDRNESFRALDDYIANELKGALQPLIPGDTSNLQFIVNPSAVSTTYRNPDAFFWQAPIAVDRTYGDVAEVGYFVQWDTSTASNPRANLCRFFVQGAKSGSSPVAVDPNFLIYTQPTSWISDSLIQTVAPANQANSYQGLFAENVVGMWVRCFDHQGNILTASGATFDSRVGYPDASVTPTVTRALPAAVEVSLALLDAASANKVTPAQQTTMVALTKTTGTASLFIQSAQTNTSLTPIRTGLRDYTIKIYLPGSR